MRRRRNGCARRWPGWGSAIDLDTPAIVCAVLPHGENGAVVRLLTSDHGLAAGYVRGGRSRRLRPLLQPGNAVRARLVARVETQLAALTVELERSRTALAATALGAAALEWLTALTATVLTEGAPHPRLYAALDGLFTAMELGANRSRWLADLVRFEVLLLAEQGFGLDLSACAATGATTDLAYVSPKSMQAVSRGAGLPYAAKLLPLPAFLLGDASAAPADIAGGLATTGHFLERSLLTGRAAALLAARARLVALATAGVDAARPPG